MALSPRAQELHDQIASGGTPAGTLKKLAKATGKDHALAMELWSTGKLDCRLVAVLIMDKKLLDQELVDELCADMLDPQWTTAGVGYSEGGSFGYVWSLAFGI